MEGVVWLMGHLFLLSRRVASCLTRRRTDSRQNNESRKVTILITFWM